MRVLCYDRGRLVALRRHRGGLIPSVSPQAVRPPSRPNPPVRLRMDRHRSSQARDWQQRSQPGRSPPSSLPSRRPQSRMCRSRDKMHMAATAAAARAPQPSLLQQWRQQQRQTKARMPQSLQPCSPALLQQRPRPRPMQGPRQQQLQQQQTRMATTSPATPRYASLVRPDSEHPPSCTQQQPPLPPAPKGTSMPPVPRRRAARETAPQQHLQARWRAARKTAPQQHLHAR